MNELLKNLKIIFRSWSSMSLLVIGPLALILLIGYAFSGTDVHDVKIGIHSDSYDNLGPFIQNFSGIGEIIRYQTIAYCLNDMQRQAVHICLDMELEMGDLPTGNVVFYYDNSRKTLSNALVKEFRDFLGVKTEEISLEGAKTLFSNIENLVVFLGERDVDIKALINESQSMREDLIERKEQLIHFREEFDPKYYAIKKLHSRIENLSSAVQDDYNAFVKYKEDLLNDLNRLSNTSTTYYRIGDSIVTTVENLTNYTIFDPRDYLESLDISGLTDNEYAQLLQDKISLNSNSLEESLLNMTSNVNSTIAAIEEFKKEFDASVALLDQIKILLDQEIENSDEYVKKIDTGREKVEEIEEQLNANLDELSKINPSLAEKLVKPILESYEPLFGTIPNIKLAFPTLLAQITLFISILFANIVTLSEINSNAFLRNMVAPVQKIRYTLGLVLTNLLVVAFQVIVLVLVAQFQFNVDVFSMIIPVALVALLLSLIFIFLGMTCAYVFKSEQTSILSITFIALGFFLFSDMVAPLETMPVPASRLAGLNPFVLASGAFKKLILVGLPIIQSEVIILGIFAVVTGGILVYSSNKRRL